MDSLENDNFETIRKSTYFEGSSDILTREEFEGFKEDIIKAIKGEESKLARVEKNVIGDKIIVKPFILTINDLSPDVRLFIDEKETNIKVENGMKVKVLPGKHRIKYQLITPYYKEDKEREVDTSNFIDGKLEEVSGFNFRDVTISTDDEGSFLVINNNSYMALNKGDNLVKNMPSVELEIYSKAENDENFVSEPVKISPGMNKANLKLTKRINTNSNLSNTQGKKTTIITVPKNTKVGQTVPGTKKSKD